MQNNDSTMLLGKFCAVYRFNHEDVIKINDNKNLWGESNININIYKYRAFTFQTDVGLFPRITLYCYELCISQ